MWSEGVKELGTAFTAEELAFIGTEISIDEIPDRSAHCRQACRGLPDFLCLGAEVDLLGREGLRQFGQRQTASMT